MSTNSSKIQLRIESELSGLTDSRVLAHIRGLLVPPVAIERQWDYGTKGQTFPCWTVLRHEKSDTAIVFCEQLRSEDPMGRYSCGHSIELAGPSEHEL